MLSFLWTTSLGVWKTCSSALMIELTGVNPNSWSRLEARALHPVPRSETPSTAPLRNTLLPTRNTIPRPRPLLLQVLQHCYDYRGHLNSLQLKVCGVLA